LEQIVLLVKNFIETKIKICSIRSNLVLKMKNISLEQNRKNILLELSEKNNRKLGFKPTAELANHPGASGPRARALVGQGCMYSSV
jgi:hypothetical protein